MGAEPTLGISALPVSDAESVPNSDALEGRESKIRLRADYRLSRPIR